MGGLFVDVYVVWLFKTIQRALRLCGASGWPTVTGIVRGVYCSKRYTTVQITYTYSLDGETYAGIEEKPFLADSSAEHYQKSFAVDSPVVVRVSRSDPN